MTRVAMDNGAKILVWLDLNPERLWADFTFIRAFAVACLLLFFSLHSSALRAIACVSQELYIARAARISPPPPYCIRPRASPIAVAGLLLFFSLTRALALRAIPCVLQEVDIALAAGISPWYSAWRRFWSTHAWRHKFAQSILLWYVEHEINCCTSTQTDF